MSRSNKFYKTLAEARLATQKLGATTIAEYREKRKTDPNLPASPEQLYSKEWVDWYDFGVSKKPQDNYYKALLEAKKAGRKLGIKSESQYRKNYKNDPALPPKPERHYSEEWIDWYDFLGNEKKQTYKTLTDASQAAQELGIKTQKEYNKKYKTDPMLPSTPDKVYSKEWTDWGDFFCSPVPAKHYYKALAESKKGAQKLGLRARRDYIQNYKKDPKLPPHPDRCYPEEWAGWEDFLGTKKRVFYETYTEASKAAQKLGAASITDYKSLFKRDPRLPSAPNKFYSEKWLDWHDFLGKDEPFYKTIEEVSEAAKRLNIKTAAEYKRRYKEDSKLPCYIQDIYPDEYTSMAALLGNDKAVEYVRLKKIADEKYPIWLTSIQDYVASGKNIRSKKKALSELLLTFVIKNNYPDHPETLLHTDTSFNVPGFQYFLSSQAPTTQRPTYKICLDFFEWILKEHCTLEDTGVALPGYRNPVKTIMAGYNETLKPASSLSQSNKPVLPLYIVQRCREWLFPHGKTTLKELIHLHEFFTTDWYEINSDLIDPNDKNCVFRKKKVVRNRIEVEVTQIWTPIRAIALFFLLRLPLRGQQILWLGSGEADSSTPIISDGQIKWVPNISKLVGQTKEWLGVFKRSENDEVVMYVNTNKTGEKYIIPYFPEELLYWLIVLRDWQAKYNPLDSLTAWTKISLADPVNPKILKQRGYQTFLFRNFSIDKISPLQPKRVFQPELPRILKAVEQFGENLTSTDPATGDITSPFTPHALRVSLITAYVLDGEVPISVVSKLVGHSSIVMTIYYTKIGQHEMRKQLAEAEKRAIKSGVGRLQDLTYNKRIEEAQGELIATDVGTSMINNQWPSASYQFTDRGICPVGGGRCNEGGELIDSRTYAHVQSGYLGRRNCPRCRFFITGPAFLGGLMSLSNEISLEINTVRSEYKHFVEEVEALENEKYDCEYIDNPFRKEHKLAQYRSILEERALKLDMYLCDYVAIAKLVHQSIAILNKSVEKGGNKKQLILSGSAIEFGLSLEETSELRLLSEICQDAEIYASASASRAIYKRTQKIDAMAYMNNLEPSLFRLSEEQQLSVGNQIIQILKSRIGTWDNIEKLVNGDMYLDDIVDDTKLEPISKSIQSILNSAFDINLEHKDNVNA